MRHLTDWRDWRRRVPAECPGCGRRMAGQGLCRLCAGALAADLGQRRCPVCVHPLVAGLCPDCPPIAPAYDRIIAAFDYRGLGRDLVRAYKIHGRLALADVLADQLACAVREAGSVQAHPPRWVVPVPARRQALRQRGFSPPAEIARLLAPRLGLAYCLTGVHRLREGRKQAALGRADRLRAQSGLYACDGPDARRGWFPGWSRPARDLAGARIAVVDDVLTTGATLHAVAVALKAAGAATVEGWVLARAVRGRADAAP